MQNGILGIFIIPYWDKKEVAVNSLTLQDGPKYFLI